MQGLNWKTSKNITQTNVKGCSSNLIENDENEGLHRVGTCMLEKIHRQ